MFGISRSHIDINMLKLSQLFDRLCKEMLLRATKLTFHDAMVPARATTLLHAGSSTPTSQ